MRKIFEHLDFTRVGHFQSILESAGVPTLLKNQNTSSLQGEVPWTNATPQLWVVEDDDFDRAITILQEFTRDASVPVEGSNWRCDNCGEEVPANFSSCWNCQRDRADAAG